MRESGSSTVKRALEQLERGGKLTAAGVKALNDEFEKFKADTAARDAEKFADAARNATKHTDKLAEEMRQAKRNAGGLSSSFSGLQVTTMALVANFKTAAAAAVELFEFAKAGAMALDVAEQFDTLGISLDEMRVAAAGAIDDTTLQAAANLGVEMGLTSEQINTATTAMVALAQKSGELDQVGGKLKDTIKALAKGDEEGFTALGISAKDLDARLKDQIPTWDALDEATRAQLKVNLALADVTDSGLSPALEGKGLKAQQAATSFENMTSTMEITLAQTLSSTGAFESMNEQLKAMQAFLEANNEELQALGGQLVDVVETGLRPFLNIAERLGGDDGGGALTALSYALTALEGVLWLVSYPLNFLVNYFGDFAEAIYDALAAVRSLGAEIEGVAGAAGGMEWYSERTEDATAATEELGGTAKSSAEDIAMMSAHVEGLNAVVNKGTKAAGENAAKIEQASKSLDGMADAADGAKYSIRGLADEMHEMLGDETAGVFAESARQALAVMFSDVSIDPDAVIAFGQRVGVSIVEGFEIALVEGFAALGELEDAAFFSMFTEGIAGLGDAASPVRELAESFDEVNESFATMVRGIEFGAPAFATMLENIDKVGKANLEGEKAFAGYTDAIAKGVGAMAQGVIKDQKAQAAVMAAVEFAMAAAAFARGMSGDPLGWIAGVQHVVAGGLFTAVASGSGGSNRSAPSRSQRAARDRQRDPAVNPNAGTGRESTSSTMIFINGLLSEADASERIGKMLGAGVEKGRAPVIPKAAVGRQSGGF
jgi:hypothetical protein